jgi:uncharacterized membrane protein YdjX (TVP38/TMEM64 family)
MLSKIQQNPFFPLVIILTFVLISYGVFYAFPLSLNSLREINQSLQLFASHHPLLTPFLFVIVYIFFAMLPVPGIFMLSIISGYLFSQPLSTLYPVISATIGATSLFLLTRTAIGGLIYKRTNFTLIKMEKGFQENAANYLLFLRFIPLFPFWLVNIAGAFFRVPLKTFIWTTFVGMIPSTFAYAQAGKGLIKAFESSAEFDGLNSILNANLVLSLFALALLSLTPMVFKKFRTN